MADDSDKLEIFKLVEGDLIDRKDWADKRIENRRMRIERTRKNRKLPYPGAPDLSEPLIDDQIGDVVSSKMSILWNSRTLAQFLPLDATAMQAKPQAESAFDTMLRLTLSVRAKLNVLFDLESECGMSIAKMVETVVDGQTLSDFVPLDPQDVVVPTGTLFMRDAERITHMIRYTKEEFEQEAKRRGWTDWEEVVKKAANAEGGAGSSDASSPTVRSVSNEKNLPNSAKEIVVYEIYHWECEEKGEGATAEASEKRIRKVTNVSPGAPDTILSSFPWEYKPFAVSAEIRHPEDPTIIIKAAQIDTGGDRPWPFVQFRDEDRSLRYYDVRGVSEKLADDQVEASAARQMRAIMMDYGSKPFIQGDKAALASFRWRAGEVLPPGTSLVFPNPSTQSLTYSIDLARNVAARRAGASQGGLSSVDQTKDKKTATEVNQSMAVAGSISGNAVERFAEPLGELFTMMWKWLQREAMIGQVKLPYMSGGMFGAVNNEVFKQNFIVVSGVSSRSANPFLMRQNLQALGQFLQQFPAIGQYIKPAELAKIGVDMIDPHLTETVVFDPSGGAMGAPIEMQLKQAMSALQSLSQQVATQGRYLSSIAAHDTARGQQEQAPQFQQPPQLPPNPNGIRLIPGDQQ